MEASSGVQLDRSTTIEVYKGYRGDDEYDYHDLNAALEGNYGESFIVSNINFIIDV